MADTSRDTRGSRQVIRKAIPLSKGTPIHNTAKNSGVDFFASDITPSDLPSLVRVMVCLDTAAVFKAEVKNGGNAQLLSYNGGAQLTADCVYHFDLILDTGDTYNFQVDQNVTIKTFRIIEVLWAVQ